MNKRLVIVGYPLKDPSAIEAARAVSDQFEIVYIPFRLGEEAMRAFAHGTPQSLQTMTPQFPRELLDRLPEAEIVYGLYFPVDLLERAPKLKWVANLGSGTEQYKALGILESPVTLTSSKGVAARSIAEFAMAQLLMLAKQFPERMRLQQAHKWRRVPQADLHGQTLGIVGLGEIGSEAARLAKAFGMRVLATRRRASGDLPANVDAMFPVSDLRRMLAECDAVLLSLAYTTDTYQLIGAAELAAMEKSAFLVNVARGEVVDEEALVKALQDGSIAGAALDVFVEEPLPKHSPLWDLPNVVISSHNAVGMGDYFEAAFGAFVRNLRRYANGEALQQVVDPRHRY